MSPDRPNPDSQGRGIFPAELLDRCISCGFCLPACPTYALTKEEKSSPRGRINLMRMLETGELEENDPTLREESSFCLGCRACEPVCPAGVQYGELLEHWRTHQWSGFRTPPVAAVLTQVVQRQGLVAWIGRLRPHARTPVADSATSTTEPPASLMLGCFERGLFPRVSRAARRLRPELSCPADQGCCGALHAHNGDRGGGLELARRLGEQLPGVIVTTAGGCAAHLAAVLGEDRVREFSSYVSGDPDAMPPLGEVRMNGRRARVGLQDSCHLRNGLGVWQEPRQLIAQVADYVEVPGAAQCCGSAGTYSLLRPQDSRRILAPKLDSVESLDLDVVVTVNPGCQRQLQSGLRRRRSRVRVLHLVELLALAVDADLRRSRPPRRSRQVRPSDEAGGLESHLNDRPAPTDPGASGAGRPEPTH
ncbi:MAG TPA: (Fe-S)-binding protein [Propionibacteriaceae bacterium]|nr:(Fe-S)-binding protein [Propionibacteriaceae bacterium]